MLLVQIEETRMNKDLGVSWEEEVERQQHAFSFPLHISSLWLRFQRSNVKAKSFLPLSHI